MHLFLKIGEEEEIGKGRRSEEGREGEEEGSKEEGNRGRERERGEEGREEERAVEVIEEGSTGRSSIGYNFFSNISSRQLLQINSCLESGSRVCETFSSSAFSDDVSDHRNNNKNKNMIMTILN